MTWITGLDGCVRWFSSATVASWRSWRLSHPKWVPPLRHVALGAARCVKGGLVALPLSVATGLPGAGVLAPSLPFPAALPFAAAPWLEGGSHVPALPGGAFLPSYPIAAGPGSAPPQVHAVPFAVPPGSVLVPPGITPAGWDVPHPGDKPVPVPEPGTLAILASAVLGMALLRWRAT